MEKYVGAGKLLLESIITNDIIILGFAIATLICFVLMKFVAKSIKKNKYAIKKERSKWGAKFLWKNLSKFYTLFVTLITIFPLLGMFGTVIGLLGLDLTTGDMENIRSNFFLALTSTAWGIIFSVFFKMLHAWNADFIEEQIEIAKQLTEESK